MEDKLTSMQTKRQCMCPSNQRSSVPFCSDWSTDPRTWLHFPIWGPLGLEWFTAYSLLQVSTNHFLPHLHKLRFNNASKFDEELLNHHELDLTNHPLSCSTTRIASRAASCPKPCYSQDFSKSDRDDAQQESSCSSSSTYPVTSLEKVSGTAVNSLNNHNHSS